MTFAWPEMLEAWVSLLIVAVTWKVGGYLNDRALLRARMKHTTTIGVYKMNDDDVRVEVLKADGLDRDDLEALRHLVQQVRDGD